MIGFRTSARSTRHTLISSERFADSAYALHAHAMRALGWRRQKNFTFEVADIPHGAGSVVEKALQALVAAEWHEDDRANEASCNVLII